jgi:putative transposase
MKVNLMSTWQQKASHVSAVNSKAYSTKRYCKLIGLNTSSYYAIKARQALPVIIKPEQTALKATFMASGQTYGSRRLVKAMHRQGFTMGSYRVRRMMKSAQLVPAPALLFRSF